MAKLKCWFRNEQKNVLQMSLYLIGRDEFRTKCIKYEKENFNLREGVSRIEKFRIKAPLSPICLI